MTPSSDMTSRLVIERAAVDLLPFPLPLLGARSSPTASVSSNSTSSTKVGSGIMVPARAVSTSSALTEVLCLRPRGVRLGVTPEIRPPSGAVLNSVEAPDSRLDFLTGVVTCSELSSLTDDLLVLLVGVLASSFKGVACFSGVRCFGMAEILSGVVGVFDSTSSRERSTFLEDLLDLLGVTGLESP